MNEVNNNDNPPKNQEHKKVNSFNTIFSIWNSMIGSSASVYLKIFIILESFQGFFKYNVWNDLLFYL